MKQSDKTPPPKPEKPSPNECCGSGCTPCVFDYYYSALEKWQEQWGQNEIKSEIKSEGHLAGPDSDAS